MAGMKIDPNVPAYVIRRSVKVPSDKKPMRLYWRSKANNYGGGWVEWQSLATRFTSAHACRVEISDKIGISEAASTRATIVRLKPKADLAEAGAPRAPRPGPDPKPVVG